MAYFERSDERDRLIVCNICNVKCAERSITIHKYNCHNNYKKKFDDGDLLRCEFDTSHVVPKGRMNLHLEFCNKYQNVVLADYQQAFRQISISPESTSSSGPIRSLSADSELTDGISKLGL